MTRNVVAYGRVLWFKFLAFLTLFRLIFLRNFNFILLPPSQKSVRAGISGFSTSLDVRITISHLYNCNQRPSTAFSESITSV